MIRHQILRGLACLAFASVAIGPVLTTTAHAAYIVTLKELGSDVVATGAGSIDLTDLDFCCHAGDGGQINGSQGSLLVGAFELGSSYSGYTGPSSFGTINQTFGTSSDSGDMVGIGIVAFVADIVVPSAYVSGAPLSELSTWDNQTLSTMGLTSGTYVYSWGAGAHADTFTVKIGEVPEVSTWAMMLLGFVGLGVLGRRVSKASTIIA